MGNHPGTGKDEKKRQKMVDFCGKKCENVKDTENILEKILRFFLLENNPENIKCTENKEKNIDF